MVEIDQKEAQLDILNDLAIGDTVRVKDYGQILNLKVVDMENGNPIGQIGLIYYDLRASVELHYPKDFEIIEVIKS